MTTGPGAQGPLARLGAFLTDLCERYFPDAFVFALAGVVLVFVAGLALGESPARLVTEFGSEVLIPLSSSRTSRARTAASKCSCVLGPTIGAVTACWCPGTAD